MSIFNKIGICALLLITSLSVNANSWSDLGNSDEEVADQVLESLAIFYGCRNVLDDSHRAPVGFVIENSDTFLQLREFFESRGDLDKFVEFLEKKETKIKEAPQVQQQLTCLQALGFMHGVIAAEGSNY